jgi:hypothetical protein
LGLITEDNPLDCLQRFLRGLREGRRQKDMDSLALYLTDYTQEIIAGVVDVFQCCVSKRIKWKQLIVCLPGANQNRFLHLILSEAQNLQQFKEVDLTCPWNRAVALTNETAMELHAMISSEQGLERLRLCNMQLLPGVLSTLAQGLRANQVGALEFLGIQIMEKDVMGREMLGGGGSGPVEDLVVFFSIICAKYSEIGCTKAVAFHSHHLLLRLPSCWV